MEYLGGRNLFTSHFIMGCREVNREFTKTETLEIEALHKWLDFKDNDWGMDKYRTNRTQYIDFLEIIELETFKEITEGLYKSYCNEFPYSTKKDFIKHVFDYTIFDLECFLKLDVHWLGEAPNENNYSFYTVYSHDDREFLDFAINSKFEIVHYKQYYKAVLEYLKSFESDITEQAETSNKFQRVESDLDKMIWAYEAYVINCKYSFDNVERIRKRSSEMYDREIFNIAHRAVQELKSMVLTGNPQFENTANYYFTKCRKILDEHQKNIKDNNLNHVEVMPKIRDYFDTMQPLYNFHDEVLLLLPKLKEQLEQNEVLPPQQSEKQKPKQETPKTFDELFYNTDLVIPCVDILKELDPPLIDTDYNYIGKLKGVFCVWIDEMKRQGVVKSNYPEERKLFTELIPQKIKRFSIDESMFGKYQKKAEDNYRTEIKTKISNIKLSQNSQ